MNLINYRTNETIREATIAEAIESLAAADAAGSSGAIMAGGIACYVDASEDEIRAAGVDDAETFGREVAR